MSVRRVSVLIALVALGACRDGGSELATYQAKVAEAVPKIEAALGLPFKTPPVVEVRSKEEVRQYLEKQLTDSLAREQVAGQERALKRLGLMPDTMSLERLLLDVLEEQVGGYYDPRAKVLYIVENTPEEAVGLTVLHELIHALQDQHLNLDSVMRATGDDDRTAAAQAVLEGQATYEGLRLMVGAEMADNFPGGWDRARQMIRDDHAKWPAFASAPLVVQEMLLFPYLSGAEFARAFRVAKPGQTPYADMPTSTEQILHPPLFLGNIDEPTTVVLPPLAGGTTIYDNTVGEFTTRLFIYEHLREQQAAMSGGAGWDGDRFVLLRTPRGEGSVWVSVWDTQIDAGDFYMLIERTVDRRYGPSPARTLSRAELGTGMSNGRAYTVGGRSVSIRTGEIAGRPVVVYVDMPAGDDLNVLDVARVRLTQPATTAPAGSR